MVPILWYSCSWPHLQWITIFIILFPFQIAQLFQSDSCCWSRNTKDTTEGIYLHLVTVVKTPSITGQRLSAIDEPHRLHRRRSCLPPVTTGSNQTPGSQTPSSSASTVCHDCPHRCHGSSDWNLSYLLPPAQICLAGFRAKKIDPRPILVFKEWAKALCNRIPDIIFLQNSSELAKRSWHCFSFHFSRIFTKNLSRIWG